MAGSTVFCFVLARSLALPGRRPKAGRRWMRPRGAEECYRVERDGAAVRLLKDGSEAWFGTLKSGR